MADDGLHHHEKRQRMSPPLTPSRDEGGNDDMDVVEAAPAERESTTGSDASSDWGDWADALVAQGETSTRGRRLAAPAREDGAGANNEEDAWVRAQMEQPSVVLEADDRAWDCVLRMVVDDQERSPGAATVVAPLKEISGAAAVEIVCRWLHSNLPIALPSFNALRLASTTHLRGRAVADSVALPSAVAVIWCFPEQSMPRINLFSLSADAGSALAAALVQPGAAGLQGLEAAESPHEDPHNGVRSGAVGTIKELSAGGRRSGLGRRKRGVVFESLDSRIMEDALVASMERLGLCVKCRSRSGLWKLRPGAVPLPTSGWKGRVTPLVPEDASFIARCCSPRPAGSPPTDERACGGAEALVRGLLRRNPSAGIRRGNQLVAWCLSFDNGLAGALHVVASSVETPFCEKRRDYAEGGDSSPQDLVVALLSALLAEQPDTGLATEITSDKEPPADRGGGARAARSGTGTPARPSDRPSALAQCVSSTVRTGLAAVVVDDDSPFVGHFQQLGLLDRVCDADWVRFEPVAYSSSRSSTAPAAVGDSESEGLGVGGPWRSPLAVLMTDP